MASRITSQEQTHCHKCHGEVLCQGCEAEVFVIVDKMNQSFIISFPRGEI